MYRIESLLSARSFVRPQASGNRLFFISNLSGHLSLYAMDYGGSVPEPLLPGEIALQNPHLITGYSYYVFPALKKILVMIDQDGDENYQPMLIPIDGGFPEPAFNNFFVGKRVHFVKCDAGANLVYFAIESRQDDTQESFQGNLATGELVNLGSSIWGNFPSGASEDHNAIILIDGYTAGDNVLYLWTRQDPQRRLLFGTPREARQEGETPKLNAIGACEFVRDAQGLLFTTALFSDLYGLGYFDLANPEGVRPVEIHGMRHTGTGELVNLDRVGSDHYLVAYNIDGCDWLYEGRFDEQNLQMFLTRVVCGEGPLANGVLDSYHYDRESDRFTIAFSSATSPTQVYTVEGADRRTVRIHTREKVFGTPSDLLSPGEDASFVSFDGTRVSARLYLPAGSLGFTGPRPLVYYVHGGPQGQERPDFAWFSMPLIQFLTFNGFAVFVPNVRGSTGYGLNYAKQVDNDWGGEDRLDHIQAMKVLAKDARVDVSRAGVVGRSYGGYMTLTLAARHPDLWKAAVDMFGPFDLLSFIDRIPPTWKTYFKLTVGDPENEKDRAFMVERSPRTYIDQISCPLLVIQGKNDPRVVERESHDLVDYLRSKGKTVDYIMFENEGHDVLKYENRVRCYSAITDYFRTYLKP